MFERIRMEFEQWLSSHDYILVYMFFSDSIFIFTRNKISDEDILDFKDKFHYDLTLNEVSYSESGKKFEYCTSHLNFELFKKDVIGWLDDNINYWLAFVSEKIKIICDDKLECDDVQKIEMKFGLKLTNYKVKCKGKFHYEFS